jgi:hypothetical protein
MLLSLFHVIENPQRKSCAECLEGSGLCHAGGLGLISFFAVTTLNDRDGHGHEKVASDLWYLLSGV